MTDMWFRLKEISKQIAVLKSYSDAWDFITKVASGEMTYLAMITEAKCLLDSRRNEKSPFSEPKKER